jgi:hypothetical protein
LSARAGRAAKLFAAILAVILLLGAAALIAAPFAIERVVNTELEKRGIAAAEMKVGTPSPGGVTVRELRLGADEAFTADQLRVEYSLPELARGRIERIRLVRPRLRMSVSEQGEVSLGSLDPLLRGSGGQADGNAPQLGLPAPLEIVDGAVTASTPGGDFTARLDGAVTLEPGAGPLQLAIDGQWLRARLELRLAQDGSGVQLSGRIAEGRITHPLLSANFAGPFTASTGAETPAGSAELAVTELRSPLVSIGAGASSGDLSAWYERGRIAGDLRLGAPGGQFELSLLGETPQSFRIGLNGDGLAVPELIQDARVAASFEVDPAASSATLSEAASIQGRLAPELLAELPAAVQPNLKVPLSLTAEPGSRVARGPSGLSASGRLRLAGAEDLELVLDGSLSPQAGGAIVTAEARLNAPSVTLAGYTLKKLSLTAPLAASIADSGTEVRLTGPAPLSIGSLESGATRLAGLAIPLRPDAGPLFATGPEGASFALRADAAKADGRFGEDREPFSLEWKEASVQGRPGAMLTAAISGARLVLSRLGWEAQGLSARLQADEAKTDPPVVEIEITRLAQTAKQPSLAPLALTGILHPTDRAVRFDLRGRAADGQARLRAKGSHDLMAGRGSATIELEPLRFAAGGLQPNMLVPALGDVLRDASGTLTAGGKIGWSGKGLMSDLEITLERMGFLSPAGPVLGLNGRVRLNGLAPLSTPPGQRLTIDAVEAAVPVSEVALQFGLREGRFLDIEDGGLSLAGGRISLAPVVLDRQADRNEIALEFSQVQLPILFDLVGLDGLTGTGRLSGHVPVMLERGDIAIRGGTLESQEPGQIRYEPSKPPSALQGGGESVGLALAALKNFHYDRLTLKLHREIGGETLVGLHIAGKNPDFYGGYPVEFNLNLSGKLDQILIQGLAGYRLPDTIQNQLEQSTGGSSSPSAP